MRDLAFLEIRECNKAIAQMEDKQKTYEMLINTVRKMIELTNIGRDEGIIQLEEVCISLSGLENVEYLKEIMENVIDCTHPEVIEDMFLARYFAYNLSGATGLQYLIFLYGGIAIQDGENPLLLKRRLLSFLPKECIEMYK